jgi:hypothetical protein
MPSKILCRLKTGHFLTQVIHIRWGWHTNFICPTPNDDE